MSEIITEQYNFDKKYDMIGAFEKLAKENKDVKFITRSTDASAPVYQVGNSAAVVSYKDISFTGYPKMLKETKKSLEQKLGVKLKKI